MSEKKQKDRRALYIVLEIVSGLLILGMMCGYFIFLRNRGAFEARIHFANYGIVILFSLFLFAEKKRRPGRVSAHAIVMIVIVAVFIVMTIGNSAQQAFFGLYCELRSAEHYELTQEDIDRYVNVSAVENMLDGLRLTPKEKNYIAAHPEEYEKIVVGCTLTNDHKWKISHIVNDYREARHDSREYGGESFCARRSVEKSFSVVAGGTAEYEFVIIARKDTRDYLPQPEKEYIYPRFGVYGSLL